MGDTCNLTDICNAATLWCGDLHLGNTAPQTVRVRCASTVPLATDLSLHTQFASSHRIAVSHFVNRILPKPDPLSMAGVQAEGNVFQPCFISVAGDSPLPHKVWAKLGGHLIRNDSMAIAHAPALSICECSVFLFLVPAIIARTFCSFRIPEDQPLLGIFYWAFTEPPERSLPEGSQNMTVPDPSSIITTPSRKMTITPTAISASTLTVSQSPTTKAIVCSPVGITMPTMISESSLPTTIDVTPTLAESALTKVIVSSTTNGKTRPAIADSAFHKAIVSSPAKVTTCLQNKETASLADSLLHLRDDFNMDDDTEICSDAISDIMTQLPIDGSDHEMEIELSRGMDATEAGEQKPFGHSSVKNLSALDDLSKQSDIVTNTNNSFSSAILMKLPNDQASDHEQNYDEFCHDNAGQTTAYLNILSTVQAASTVKLLNLYSTDDMFKAKQCASSEKVIELGHHFSDFINQVCIEPAVSLGNCQAQQCVPIVIKPTDESLVNTESGSWLSSRKRSICYRLNPGQCAGDNCTCDDCSDVQDVKKFKVSEDASTSKTNDMMMATYNLPKAECTINAGDDLKRLRDVVVVIDEDVIMVNSKEATCGDIAPVIDDIEGGGNPVTALDSIIKTNNRMTVVDNEASIGNAHKTSDGVPKSEDSIKVRDCTITGGELLKLTHDTARPGEMVRYTNDAPMEGCMTVSSFIKAENVSASSGVMETLEASSQSKFNATGVKHKEPLCGLQSITPVPFSDHNYSIPLLDISALLQALQVHQILHYSEVANEIDQNYMSEYRHLFPSLVNRNHAPKSTAKVEDTKSASDGFILGADLELSNATAQSTHSLIHVTAESLPSNLDGSAQDIALSQVKINADNFCQKTVASPSLDSTKQKLMSKDQTYYPAFGQGDKPQYFQLDENSTAKKACNNGDVTLCNSDSILSCPTVCPLIAVEDVTLRECTSPSVMCAHQMSADCHKVTWMRQDFAHGAIDSIDSGSSHSSPVCSSSTIMSILNNLMENAPKVVNQMKAVTKGPAIEEYYPRAGALASRSMAPSSTQSTRSQQHWQSSTERVPKELINLERNVLAVPESHYLTYPRTTPFADGSDDSAKGLEQLEEMPINEIWASTGIGKLQFNQCFLSGQQPSSSGPASCVRSPCSGPFSESWKRKMIDCTQKQAISKCVIGGASIWPPCLSSNSHLPSFKFNTETQQQSHIAPDRPLTGTRKQDYQQIRLHLAQGQHKTSTSDSVVGPATYPDHKATNRPQKQTVWKSILAGPPTWPVKAVCLERTLPASGLKLPPSTGAYVVGDQIGRVMKSYCQPTMIADVEHCGNLSSQTQSDIPLMHIVDHEAD